MVARTARRAPASKLPSTSNQAAKNVLSEADLAKVVGGFNPQPDPPRIAAKFILASQFGIR
jgi:hypothetical protein